MQQTLNWGILATGRIAGTFARALTSSTTSKLVAVASRTQESATRFGQEHNISRCYGTYQHLLDDPQVQAVYISTPHPMHAEWAIKAARAGKHILCEKPLSMNAAEAAAMIAAARDNRVCLMEAFMYRFHPQTAKVIDLLRKGTIGQIRQIQATYSFNGPFNPQSRLFDKSLGGGGILDVGCYPVSYVRLIAGIANGQDFADPIDLHAVGHLGPSGVDDWTAAVCRFPGDIIAQLSTALQLQQENGLRIYGSGGQIHLEHAFHPAYWSGQSKITVRLPPPTPLWEITIQADKPLFTIAIDAFAKHAMQGQQQVTWPGMRWDDTLGNMRTLDRWRKEIGLEYEADTASPPKMP